MAPSESSSADSAEFRKQLVENHGFRQIGAPLPDNVTMRDIITSLPKKVFGIDDVKTWGSFFVSVTSYALGIYMIAKAPWYLLPLAWAWTGTATTGFFVIGHDCAHKSFLKNKIVEDIIGTLTFMSLIYPYEPWRFKYDQHRAKTNMLFEDTGWHPAMKDSVDASPLLRKALIYRYGPIRTWMSISHWLIWRSQTSHDKLGSSLCIYGNWPLIIYKTGIIGWMKPWLAPWLGFHFWMSTFTILH